MINYDKIQALRASGVSPLKLAKRFGVCVASIYRNTSKKGRRRRTKLVHSIELVSAPPSNGTANLESLLAFLRAERNKYLEQAETLNRTIELCEAKLKKD